MLDDRWIVLGDRCLGIAVGYVCNQLQPARTSRREGDRRAISPSVTDIFLRLIKMIIAPLVFATLVAGHRQHGRCQTVGRIGVKAMGWFVMRLAGLADASA